MIYGNMMFRTHPKGNYWKTAGLLQVTLLATAKNKLFISQTIK